MFQKNIKVNDKTYTLTANRATIKTIYEIAPELLSTSLEQSEVVEKGSQASINILAKLDILFYDLIKVAHPNISKEESDAILEQLDNDCGAVTVMSELSEFAMSSFTQGDQTKKKSIWE